MLFPTDFLKRIEYLSIVSKRVFQGTLLAQHRSRQTGAGIEFAEHRQYQPGDDLRYLDWNIYARHGSLLLKRFQAETDLRVHILLDCSRSMAFGAPPKFDLARQLAGALAYLALADLDRVSIQPFADGLQPAFPLSRGKAKVVPMMKFLNQLTTIGAGTSLSSSVEALLKRHAENGLVILISDFFDSNGFEHPLDLLRCSRLEPFIVQVFSSEESQPELRGDVELEDAETGAVRRVRITDDKLIEYQRRFIKHQQSLHDYCRRYQVTGIQVSSEQRYDDVIARMMKMAGATV